MTWARAATQPSRWRVVTLATLGLMILQIGWILAVPPYFGIDEIDHAYRGSSVAAGHWLPPDTSSDQVVPRGELIAVRADVASAAQAPCRQFAYMARADCTPVSRAATPGEVLIASTASRYNPVFYAATEVVAGHARGYANLYLMRATAALFCALMFGCAVWSTLVWSCSRWPLAMVMLAMTPTTLYSSTLATPNGLEMVAGLTFASTVIGLFLGRASPSGGERAWLLVLVTVSGATLVTMHTLGPVWLVLTSALVLLVVGPRQVWRRVEEAPSGFAAVAAFLALAVVSSAAWVVLTGTNQVSPTSARVAGSAWPHVLLGLVYWPIQAVATFPSRDEPAPIFVYAIVLALVAAAIHRAAPGLRGRLLVATLLLVGVSLGVPLVLTVLTYHEYGFAWQGRYGMPFTAGFFLLLGLATDRHARSGPLPARVVAVAGTLTAVVLVVCEQHLVQRQLTLALWRNNPHWHVPHLLVLVGLVTLGVGFWAAALTVGRRRVAEAPRTAVRDEHAAGNLTSGYR